ncbi:hypothetical protein [Enhygromyxa salina]|nr:hypothetical protein [Enhygromyxa salina]
MDVEWVVDQSPLASTRLDCAPPTRATDPGTGGAVGLGRPPHVF